MWLRNYSEYQRSFDSKFIDRFVTADMNYFSPSAPWSCASPFVPKNGPDEFCFTVDLRPVSQFTVKHQFSMSILEEELTGTTGSRHYALLDFSNSHWQLPLHQASQACQSFLTPDVTYPPTKILHGTTNAIMFLQSTLVDYMPDDVRQ